jgi:DNA polymerase
VIVTLGRFSMARFFGQGRIGELHGRTTTWNGITCIAMYHPAAVLRAQSPAMRQTYEEDFRKIPLLLEEIKKRRPARAPEPVSERVDQLRLF